MSDAKWQDMQRDHQLVGSDAARQTVNSRLVEVHTMLPGIIESFDPDTQTARVQPAIKRIFTEQGPVPIPVCVDVPVEFPGGGDFFLTFPVKPGDECVLAFSERCIDRWHVMGGVQDPDEYRMHSYSDGVARVGLNSQPRKIPSFNPTDAEFRSRDGSVKVQLKPDGTIKNINPAGSTELTPAGKYIINAPGGFQLNAGPEAEINAALIALNGAQTASPGAAGDGAVATINMPIKAKRTADFTDEVTVKGLAVSTHVHSNPEGGDVGPMKG